MQDAGIGIFIRHSPYCGVERLFLDRPTKAGDVATIGPGRTGGWLTSSSEIVLCLLTGPLVGCPPLRNQSHGRVLDHHEIGKKLPAKPMSNACEKFQYEAITHPALAMIVKTRSPPRSKPERPWVRTGPARRLRPCGIVVSARQLAFYREILRLVPDQSIMSVRCACLRPCADLL